MNTMKTACLAFCVLVASSVAAQDSDEVTIGELVQEMRTETEIPSLRNELTEEFLKGNKFELPRISPNGHLVATLERVGDFLELVVIDPVNRRKMRIIGEETGAASPNLDITDVNWVDNEYIAFEFTIAKLDRMGLARIIFEDGLPIDVEISLLGDNWYLLDALPHIEKKAMVMNFHEGRRTLEAVDFTKPESAFVGATMSKLQSKVRDTQSWLMDKNGRVRVAVEVDDDKLRKTLWFRAKDSLSWKKMWVGDPDVTIKPVLVEADDRTVVVVSNEHTDNSILTRYDRIEKTYGEAILDLPGYDIDSVFLNADKSEVIRVAYTVQGIVKHKYIGEKYSALADTLDPATYGSSPYIVDFSVGEKFAVIKTSTNDDPGAYYLFDIDNNLSYRFGSLRPWLSKFRLGKSQTIETVTADGLSIESYLTIPDVESYPSPALIVMPHGGPISVRDTQHFSDSVQMLSALGYAVLQTNYRGSSGFGKLFEEKGERQWGRQIEDDIEAAVQSVLNLDIVDRDRVCIFGASYGGYSALISAIRQPDLYKCAASFAGVTDMTLIFHEFRVNQSNLIRKGFKRIVGDPDEDIDALIEHSPLYNAEKITIPVFLSHGTEDGVVDMEHYYRMKLVLDRLGKEAEYLVVEGEGHGFRYLSTETDFYRRLDAFFRRTMDLPTVSLEQVLKNDATWPELAGEHSF